MRGDMLQKSGLIYFSVVMVGENRGEYKGWVRRKSRLIYFSQRKWDAARK